MDEETLQRLKQRANRHHRSLEKEVATLLRHAARMTPTDPVAEASPLASLHTVDTGHTDPGAWSRDAIYGDDGR